MPNTTLNQLQELLTCTEKRMQLSTGSLVQSSRTCASHHSATLREQRNKWILLPEPEGGVALVWPVPRIFEEANQDMTSSATNYIPESLVLLWVPDADQVRVMLPAVHLRTRPAQHLSNHDILPPPLLVTWKKHSFFCLHQMHFINYTLNNV
jgi:hypothetical protein